jgi:hypothetical protein
MAADGADDRREGGEGAGPQVVAIGEAAGEDHQLAAFQAVVLVPEEGDLLVEDVLEDVVDVVVAVAAREDDDAASHEGRISTE